MSLAIVSLAGASFFGVADTFAQTPDDQKTSLVEKIATKFNLNKAEVQAVFDEEHEARHAQMEQRFEEHLTQLVSEGKITEDQKTKIIAKFKEMKEQRDANKEEFKNMTPDERKAVHEQKQQDLKTWAESNGIDVENLHVTFGPGEGMGKHMRMKSL